MLVQVYCVLAHICTSLPHVLFPAAYPNEAFCDLPRTPPVQWCHILSPSLHCQYNFAAVGSCAVVGMLVSICGCVGRSPMFVCLTA